jgi:type I restriction enzyme S subunit
MSEWAKYRLGDVSEKIGSGATPRGGKEAYLEFGEISLIRSQNVLDFSFSKNGLAYISEEQAHELRNVIVEEGDVLLNITGDSVARVCQAPSEILPARVNQHVAIIRGKSEILNQSFLKYYLLEPSFKRYMLGLASAGATRNALTKVMIENFEIKAPEIDEQIEIASILSSLDDKIELNLQMNQTLEAMAQAIFKEWFVNFNFPGFDGELVNGLPKGWKMGKLNEVCKIEIGRTPPRMEEHWFSTDPKDIKWISIRDLGLAGVYIFNTYEYLTKEAVEKFRIPIIPANTVVLSFKLTIGRLAITTETMLSNEAIAQIKSDIFSTEYIYTYLKTYNWGTLGSTSSIATAINSKIIKEMEILIPENSVEKKFQEVIKPIFEKLKANSQEIETLTQIRDSLLPKLMTGKIEIQA